MISDDLRIQDEILIYLYDHIDKSSSTDEIQTNIDGVTFEDINRQLCILDRKGLLMFSVTPPLLSGFRETLYVRITGNGCMRAEKVLQKQEDAEKKARSWSL